MDIIELKYIIETSLKELFYNDKYLLLNKANERTIVCKLSHYLINNFISLNLLNWDIDCEYNRFVIDIKYIEDNGQKSKRYPDIIIHKRTESFDQLPKNLVVIELKKNKKFNEDLDDFRKINYMMINPKFNYNYGIYINLNIKEKSCQLPQLLFFKKESDLIEQVYNYNLFIEGLPCKIQNY